MRRFASVFTSHKRDRADRGKPDDVPVPASQAASDVTTHSKNNVQRAHTLSHIPLSAPNYPTLDTLVPQYGPRNDPAPSSGSSSGSASLQTPDDDLHSRPNAKKSWIPWLGGKKLPLVVTPSAATDVWDQPEWVSRPPPILRAPPPGNRQMRTPTDDTDEETMEDSDDDDSAYISVPRSASHVGALPINPVTTAKSRHNLQVFISHSLLLPSTPSPFVQVPGAPVFPRSCNPSRMRSPETMRSNMHRTRLLRRLSGPGELTDAEQQSILPLRLRKAPVAAALPAYDLSSIDVIALSEHMRVTPSSLGLSRWISRPCFEDRFTVWVPVGDAVFQHPVTGTNFGVAALEFSEGIEAMSTYLDEHMHGPSEEYSSPEAYDSLAEFAPLVEFDPLAEVVQAAIPAEQPADTSPSSGDSAQNSVHARSMPYINVPSPLRMQHVPASTSSTLPHSQDPTLPAVQDPSSLTVPEVSAKRGVRFAEDDKDEQIPLGYVLRMRKRKEDKARFLREEQARRVLEEEKARLEEERRKRDQERSEWEKERKAWDKEKRAMDEERKQRLYAEEVAAARLRRDAQRAGGTAFVSTGVPSTSLRELERNKVRDAGKYTRPIYDSIPSSRRQASEPSVTIVTTGSSTTSNSPPNSGSPSNSRSPSLAGHSPAPSGSRATTVYSTHTMSSEDVRLREQSTRRGSIASSSPRERAQSYGIYSGSHQSLLIPPVPPFPAFVADMPLLPPTPPFMMQQYPRPLSHHSVSPGSSSPSSSRSRHPSNSSSERVNRPPPSPQQRRSTYSSSPQRLELPQAHSSHATPRRPVSTHHRQSSGDSRTLSSTGPPRPERGRGQTPSYSRSQSSPIARGRPALPTYAAVPSPWTALPSQYGHPPTAMPVGFSMGDQGRQMPNRRQTAIS